MTQTLTGEQRAARLVLPRRAVHLAVNHYRCIGCRSCEATAPHLMAQDVDLCGRVLFDPVPPEYVDEALQAADLCPSEALALTYE
jgi:ferredoxin